MGPVAMGTVTLDTVQVAIIVGGAIVATITTVWHLGIAAGKIFNRMERIEQRVDDHDVDIQELKGMGV